MSNKNDPYNYANVHHSQIMAARTLVDQDSDMESVAGSVQKLENVESTEKKDQKPQITD